VKATLGLLGLLLCGCVERELQVDSDPPGADVYIDGKQAGKTPFRQPFTFYGTRAILVRHDGFTPTEKIVPVKAPWYQVIPLDFFFEHLWPGTLTDTHAVTIAMEPAREVDPDTLIQRAKGWREEAEKPPQK
jgi:hypothetical protein